MKNLSELRELSIDELRKKVIDNREELFNLRFQRGINQIENPRKINHVKRNIARMETLIVEASQKQ